MKIQSYKFSTAPAVPPVAPDILGSNTPEQFLKRIYQRDSMFGLDNLKASGYYRIHGWAYNFRPFMKRFVVCQYDSWQSQWAPNVTALRRATYGRIQEVVEIPKKRLAFPLNA